MPIVPSPREPVHALLARLDDAGARAASRDAAAARLRLLGANALEPLLAWLPTATPHGRRAAVGVLETLGDPRARAALLRLCADADEGVAVRALEAAGEMPAGAGAEEAATAAAARLTPHSGIALRRAALGALLRLHRAGAVEALGPLLDVLLDEADDEALRLEAAAVLADLAPRERRPVLARLLDGASEGLRARAVALGASTGGRARPARPAPPAPRRGARPGTASAGALPRAPGDGARGARASAAGDDDAAEVALPAPGAAADRGLHGDLADAVRALRAHGVGAIASVAAALRREPARSDDEAESVAAALAALGPPALPALQRALDELSSARRTSGASAGADEAPRAEAKAVLHLALARLDSRLALYDLRDMLAARPPRALRRLLAAAAGVGDASVAAEIARLVAAAPTLRDDCAVAFAAIVARERLTKRARAFKTLPPEVRKAVDALWPRRPAVAPPTNPHA
jgi:HEAT repeat protein